MSSSTIGTPVYQATTSNTTNADSTPISSKLVTGMVVTDSPLMFRNRIINGDMRIDQRNAGAVVTPGSPQYLVDRFVFRSTQVSKFSAQQVSTSGDALSAGFTKALYMKCISAHTTPLPAGDRFTIQQYIEGYNVADLQWGTAAAKPITLSFWCRSTIAGVHGGALRNEVTATRSYPFTYTINAANTWEYKTVTIPGDTSGTWATESGVGISVVWSLGVGSTLSATANAWAAGDFYSATGAVTSIATTLNAELYITGVQLEAGPTATPFERRPIGTETALCQRYFFRTTDWVLLATASQANGTYGGHVLNFALPVTMRAKPDFTAEQVSNGGSGTPYNLADFLSKADVGYRSTTNCYVQVDARLLTGTQTPLVMLNGIRMSAEL